MSCRTQTIIIYLLGLILLSSPIFAENPTLDVYPSEQELYEAYLRGDIDYQTYLNLNEIFEDGIDSTDLYLLEEIPNVSYFLQSIFSDYTGIEREQAETYLLGASPKKNGYFRTRTYQKLEENGDNKSAMILNSVINENWKVDFRYNENFDGEKKWSRRSVIYQADRGPLSKMIFGNFTARFGLGLTVGYRGKLLSKSDETFENSIVFPDYGGFNGVYFEGGRRSDAVRMLIHYDQNEDFSLRAGAVDFVREFGNFEVEGMVQGALVENRLTGIDYKHYQLGAFGRYRQDDYDVAMEIAVPKDMDGAIPNAVMEAQFRGDPFKLKLSAWNYNDDFINLTGGGRAGSLYRTVAVDTVEFEYRDKRIDQRGVLLKSTTDFDYSIRHEISFSAYGASSALNYVDMANSLIYPVNPNMKLQLRYRYLRKAEPGETATRNEYRIENKIIVGAFDLRNYIEYNDDLYDRRYLSLFSRVRGDVRNFGRVDVWLNFDKINYEDSRLDYFYGYLSEMVDVNNTVELGAKYSYRYSRSSSDKYESQFMIEMKAKW